MNSYTPAQGDLVWLEFNAQAGHEQAGRRPALVLSRREYNEKTSLAVFCPITTKPKGYPFEVIVHGGKVHGVVLADHVKSLDWKARKAQFIEHANPAVLQKTLSKFNVIIENSIGRRIPPQDSYGDDAK